MGSAADVRVLFFTPFPKIYASSQVLPEALLKRLPFRVLTCSNTSLAVRIVCCSATWEGQDVHCKRPDGVATFIPSDEG